MNNQSRYLPVVGRLALASLFLFSGLGKLAAPAATQGYIASVGLPLPVLGYLFAIAIELGGGALLVLGYRTRVVAAIMTVFTLATAFAFHHAFGDQNQLIHFLKNISIAGGLLQVVAFGGGEVSLDARRHALSMRPAQA
jgi:putative oxidoreductase